MSNPERPRASNTPDTPELDNIRNDIYTEADTDLDFLKSWDAMIARHDMLLAALACAMDGSAGDTFDEARSVVYALKQEYVTQFLVFTETTFDTIEREDAITIWTHVLQDALTQQLQTIRSLDIRAAYSMTPPSDIRRLAIAYADGRAKKRYDGRLKGRPTPPISPSTAHQKVGVEQPHELVADDDMEWINLSDVSEGDEYAPWVLDEIAENLEDHIDGLLELCPPDLYEDY